MLFTCVHMFSIIVHCAFCPSTNQDTPLSHVTTVFNRLGYVRGGPGSDWSVLWSQAYPFSSLPPSSLTALKPHQKINHFPGSGCFTSKTSLTGAGFPFVPKAYQLPQQLQELEAEVCHHSMCTLLHLQRGTSLAKAHCNDDSKISTQSHFVCLFVCLFHNR